MTTTNQLIQALVKIAKENKVEHAVIPNSWVKYVNFKKKRLLGIINTTNTHNKSGHWLALDFVKIDKNHVHIYYYDSLNKPLSAYNIKFPFNVKKVINYRTQCLKSSLCGQLCILFLTSRVENIPFQSIFSKKCRKNEELASLFFFHVMNCSDKTTLKKFLKL